MSMPIIQLVLLTFCSMSPSTERTEILRDVMVMEGFDKAESMTESNMLDYAAEYGLTVCE
jgi:hypothetical protein